eukprot:7594433-Karenia_brevis.AAC.1
MSGIGLPQLVPLEPLSIAIKARYWHAHDSFLRSVHRDLIESCDSLPLAAMHLLSGSHWTWAPAVHT